MTLFEILQQCIQKESGLSAHLLQSESLKAALAHLDQSTTALNALRGKSTPADAFATWGIELARLEGLSKQNEPKPWRFVFDAPMANGTYIEDPVVQICTGSPDYHRFVMTFTSNGIQARFDTTCVVADPDLSVIKSTNNIPLSVRKLHDEQLGIQRIAMLGAARVFIHGSQAKPEHLELVQHVQAQYNRFLDVFEHVNPKRGRGEPTSKFKTVNGGWAGAREGSTGLPLISKMVGEIIDPKFGRLPVTVMPAGGAYDRVQNVARHNYFEVPGTWGDDSKYLIGYSSAAIAFEPYGFWTEIELKNAVLQGKPVVVIAKPNDHSPMQEIEVDLPGGKKGTYRRYSDAAQAAVWIKRCWNIEFLGKFQAQHISSPEITATLNDLHTRYVEKKIGFQGMLKAALAAVPEATKKALKIELVKQHGIKLELLSEDDKKDFPIVIAAIKQNQDAINFASPALANYAKIKELAKIESSPIRYHLAGRLERRCDPQTLIGDLQSYKARRNTTTNEYYFFGIFRFFPYSYSKTQKFAAVDHLIDCIQHHKKIDEEHLGPLSHGDLAKVIATWERDTGLKLGQLLRGAEPVFSVIASEAKQSIGAHV